MEASLPWPPITRLQPEEAVVVKLGVGGEGEGESDRTFKIYNVFCTSNVIRSDTNTKSVMHISNNSILIRNTCIICISGIYTWMGNVWTLESLKQEKKKQFQILTSPVSRAISYWPRVQLMRSSFPATTVASAHCRVGVCQWQVQQQARYNKIHSGLWRTFIRWILQTYCTIWLTKYCMLLNRSATHSKFCLSTHIHQTQL